MSALSFIIPFLTAVSFFIYILLSQKAWQPKEGTTEWIRRAVSPRGAISISRASLGWTDILSGLGASIIYGAITVLCQFFSGDLTIRTIFCAACSALTVGTVFIIGKIFFGSLRAGILSAVFTAADVSLLFSALSLNLNICAGLLLSSMYILTVFFSMKHSACLAVSGLLLGGAMYFNPGFIFLILPAAVGSFAIAAGSNKKQLFWMFPLFSVLLPCIVCSTMAYFISGTLLPKFAFSFAYDTLDPVYLSCTAVCIIVTAIHTFRDRSFSALFITIGVISAVGAAFTGIPAVCLLSGLAIAYSGNIIITRGSLSGKIFSGIFAAVMLSGLIINSGLILNRLSPITTDILNCLYRYTISLH